MGGLFDQKYGKCFFCIPTKLGVTFLTGYLFLSGLLSLISWTIKLYENEGQLNNDIKRHGLVSCVGFEETTFYLKLTIETGGAAFFGLIGVLGVLDHCGSKLASTLSYLLVVIALRIFNLIMDFAYTKSCHFYPTNVMEQMVFWGVYDIPVNQEIKDKLQSWPHYGVDSVDSFLKVDLLLLYVLETIFVVLLLVYIAHVTYKLTIFFTSGEAGLGEFIGLNADVSAKKNISLVSHEDHPLLQEVNFDDTYTFQKSWNLMCEPVGKFVVRS